MTGPTALLAGRYRFKSKVEAGTKAPTWLATDEQTGKDVVLSSLATARVAALMGVIGLGHTHLASIVEVVDNPDPNALPPGAPAGAAVVVAEHIPGKTLHQMLKTARLTPAEAVTLWIRLCRAASTLHASGGAHGAISPRSIVIEPAGGRQGPILTQLLSPTSGAYCAAERLQGRGPSSADDCWALHATLFAALAAAPPFRGDTKDQLLGSIASGQMQKLSEFGVHDPMLEEIVAAGLAANLARRRANVDQLIEALERWEPERVTAVGEWEEDLATVVGDSEAMAAKMQAEAKAVAPRAGPSLPPVAVTDDEAAASAAQAPAPPPARPKLQKPPLPKSAPIERTEVMAVPEPPKPPPPTPFEPVAAAPAPPNPYDDEDDATTIMGRPEASGHRGLLAPSEPPAFVPEPPQKTLPLAQPAPPPPPPVAAQSFEQPAPDAWGVISSAAPLGMAPPPVAPPIAPLPQDFPAQAFPPPASAYPPSIPAPAPTGIPLGPGGVPALDDIEMRAAGRKPIIVLVALVLVIAIGVAVLMILNHAGVIT